MPRPIQAIALDVSSHLKLSGRQIDILCDMLRAAKDPEEKGRELNAMPPDKLLKLIGEKVV